MILFADRPGVKVPTKGIVTRRTYLGPLVKGAVERSETGGFLQGVVGAAPYEHGHRSPPFTCPPC